jgi:hypothetical protein
LRARHGAAPCCHDKSKLDDYVPYRVPAAEQAPAQDESEGQMRFTKSPLLASALVVAGVAGAVALGYGAPKIGSAFLGSSTIATTGTESPEAATIHVADRTEPAPKVPANQGNDIRVAAPHARVNVDKERGRVRVDAPHTQVQVDPDQGRVKVRAPYVNLDIRW